MSTKPKGIAPLHEDQGTHTDIVYMCLPLIAMAVFFYGPRPALLCAVAVITANLCDRLVALLRGQKYEKGEWSSEAFALLVTLMMPATASYYMVIIGTLTAVLVGKEAFGGYGAYLFHPAAVGYAVVAVSWSGRMFAYPDTSLFAFLPLGSVSGVNLVESPSHMLREGGLPTIDTVDLVLGNYAGPMGTTVLLVSHSMEDIAKYADRVLVMSNKKIAMYDTVENVFARAPELLALGLSVPQVTKIFLKLREMGVDVPADVYTVPYAVKMILEAKKRRDAGESLVLPRVDAKKGGAATC